MQPDLASEWIYQEMLEQSAIARRISERPPPDWPPAPGRVVVTGAGDCLAAAELLRELCPGRGVEALPALRATEEARSLGAGDTLIAISVSGRTPRIVEAAGRAKVAGATVIAVTDDSSAALTEHAGETWAIGASPPEALQESDYSSEEARDYVGYHHDVAQTKTFLASILTLARAAGVEASWETLPDRIAGLCLPGFFDPLATAAPEWARAGQAFVLGHGANLPLARFGAYKLFEYNRLAHFCDLEEYCHTRYFITRPGDAIVLLLSDDDGRTRASEIAPVLRELFDARVIVLRSDDVAPLDVPGSWEVAVPAGDADLERLVALLLAVEWTTYLWGRIDAPDINRFHAGYDTERLVAASMRTIRRSRIRI